MGLFSRGEVCTALERGPGDSFMGGLRVAGYELSAKKMEKQMSIPWGQDRGEETSGCEFGTSERLLAGASARVSTACPVTNPNPQGGGLQGSSVDDLA